MKTKNKCLLIAAAFLTAAQIQAAPGCRQWDLNGSYVMYQNSIALANLHTGRCEVTVSNGWASGTCAFVGTDNGKIKDGFSGSVTGTASINRDCSASMELDFSPAPNVTVQSFFDLQFTPDKQSFIGQWTNNFGLLGTSSGTRYSPRLAKTPE